MTKWEYFVAIYESGTFGWKWSSDELKRFDFITGMDGLGDSGWELVSTVPTVRSGETISIEYLFKRMRG